MSLMKVALLAAVCLSLSAAAYGKTCGAWDRCGGLEQDGSPFEGCSGCEAGYVCWEKNAFYHQCLLPKNVPPAAPGTRRPPTPLLVTAPPTTGCSNGNSTNGTACGPITLPNAPSGSVGRQPVPPLATPSSSGAYPAVGFNTFWAVALVALLASSMWL